MHFPIGALFGLVALLAACGPDSGPALVEVERPSATISGRVLEPPDRPLASVRVRVHSGAAPWNALTKTVEFEAATDALGFFRVDVPIPTPERFVLELDPDRFHLRHSEVLSADVLHPSLGADAGFAGEFVLGLAGVVAGRVVTRDGVPIAGAIASAGTTTASALDGTFQLEHVPVDTARTDVDLSGFGSRTIEHPPVRARVVTYLPDVVLGPPAKIAGVVVDRDGLPIESAQIDAAPLSGGLHAQARSDAQGRFAIELPRSEAHTLEVIHDAFLRRMTLDETRAAIEPGREDVRIVLDHPRPVTFVVLDAVTGSHVDHVAIEVVEDAPAGWRANAYSSSRRGAPVNEETDDVGSAPAIVTARPSNPPANEDERANEDADADEGADEDTGLAQPFFLPFRGPFRLDAGSTDRMTIRLARAGSIRVQIGPAEAAPAAKLLARLVEPDDRDIGRWSSGFSGRSNGTRNGDPLDPEFVMRGLVPGTYDVTIESATFVRRSIAGVHVATSEDVDLGRIELTRGATVRGRIVLREGVPLDGLFVRAERESKRVETAADGTFAFTDLSAGKHRLTLLDSKPRVLARRSVEFEIEAGGVIDVVIDARD